MNNIAKTRMAVGGGVKEEKGNTNSDFIFSKIEPIYKNSVSIVLSTDKNFIPYVGVAIKSLIENSSKDNNYDIVILYENIDNYNQKRIKSMEKDNISIRFYDMTELISKNKQDWYIHLGYSNAVYYRFFIPLIFANYDKVIFLDGDMIFLSDIAETYNIDIGNNWIGGVQDISQQMSGYWAETYREKVLQVKRENYINAGMMLMNINELKKSDFTKLCINKLQELKNPPLQDQDVINFIAQNHIKYISSEHNYMINCIHGYHDAKERIKPEIYEKYINAGDAVKNIHYCAGIRPWTNPELYFSQYFWKYARLTVFYEEIIYKNLNKDNFIKFETLKNVIKRRNIYINYLKCKLLKHISLGNKRKYYKEKTTYLKEKISDYRKVLK